MENNTPKTIINVALTIAIIVAFIFTCVSKGLLALAGLIVTTAIAIALLELNGKNVSHYNNYSKD